MGKKPNTTLVLTGRVIKLISLKCVTRIRTEVNKLHAI